ncbi:hypothetical protein [Agromyces soli]|uniref:TIR domain-containing protein n=1 Tax=Agromyces soli TaxID=659012 RepID=A0ABY4AT34_9MICO|nr:hypothetical protein [Agromyces soli]UOE26323.1 hypothetical protein MTP13_00665 [Agromyces soli]
MPQFTVSEARNAGVARAQYQFGGAREVLRKSVANAEGRYDIFLSHSLRDAELILGVREILQRTGKRVYVDWIDDPQLDRSHVTRATAAQLRGRMIQCSSLVYAATPASTASKWMPWELGFFDGHKGPEAVAIMQLVDFAGQSVGQEYLGIYPKIERTSTGAPEVTQRENGRILRKSLHDLVQARGGAAWRSTF